MRFLMCPPDAFSIAYEINPWMNKENQVDPRLAQEQWENLYSAYRERGIRVDLMKPIEGLPDMVFCANGGLVVGKKAIPARFRYPERQGEEPHFRSWFEKEKFAVESLPDNVHFEGQGEALRTQDRLFLGFGFRANSEAKKALENAIDLEVIPLSLADPRFYHLDTCFCPIDSKTVLYYPSAFREEAQTSIRKHFQNRIPVDEKIATAFACNAVVIDKEIFLSDGADDSFDSILKEFGYRPVHFDMSEFRKSGGGVRCLTLTLET